MKKALILLGLLGTSTPSFASVCIMQTLGTTNNGYADVISDAVLELICDGKEVSPSAGATATLQKYLTNGYKLQGQSSSGGAIIYTLVK